MTNEEIGIIGKLIKDANEETRSQLESMEMRIEDRIASLATEVREIRTSQIQSDRQFIEFKAETNLQVRMLIDSRDKFGERLGVMESKVTYLDGCYERDNAVDSANNHNAMTARDRFRFWIPVIIAVATVGVSVITILIK